MNLYLDIETNYAHSVIWCAGVSIDEGEPVILTDPEELKRLVAQADKVIGHNIVSFDAPVLKLRWKVTIPFRKLYDTLLVSRLNYPDREGGHSLDAWGKRLGMFKGDYTDHDSPLDDTKADYCKQDVRILRRVYKEVTREAQEYIAGDIAIPLEHEVAHIIAQQVARGVSFDMEGAKQLRDGIEFRMSEIEAFFAAKCPPREVQLYSIKTQKPLKPYQEHFNIGSRIQIVEKLFEWGLGSCLTERTETGRYKVDEETLEGVNTPEAKLLNEYLNLQKRIGLVDSWIASVASDGRIHGKVITNGAATGRMTHCVPLTTKALTRDGWVGHSALKAGDEVLGFNMKTGMKEWTKVVNVHYSDSAVVGSVGTETRRIRCTQEHKLVEVVSPGKPYQHYVLREADKIRKHSAVLVNAPYNNVNVGGQGRLPDNKYQTNQMSFVTRANASELGAWLTGFLLADGYYRGGWQFAQAEGHLLDVAQTALYLYSETRVSRASKSVLKGPKQRWGYNVRQTGKGWMRSKARMQWVKESVEPVWCPETELGTWVLLQEDGLMTISGNSSPNCAQVPRVGSLLGKECRSLFRATPGKTLVGIDASGLELRMLAHYMRDQQYTQAVVSGSSKDGTDVHTLNQKAAGLPSRDDAKTFILM